MDANSYGLALSYLVHGLTTESPFSILQAKLLFEIHEFPVTKQREKEISRFGADYSDNILSKGITSSPTIESSIELFNIKKGKPPALLDYSKVIIGKSSIKLKNNAIIKTQVDRVVRDWLSAFNKDLAPWDLIKEKNGSLA